jgi:ArsR family transcriptional regulator
MTAETCETTLLQPAQLLNALADPARLRILNLIKHGGEVCNCQIGPVTGFIPSKISRHLALLKQAGLLAERREGTYIHYQIAETEDPLTRQALALIDTLATRDPCLQQDRETLDAHICCD